MGAPSGVATPMIRISSGRQSPTAQSGSGSPHRSWEPTGWTVRPSPLLPTAPTVPKLAAILLHPTNQRIAASTGCGQAARCAGRIAAAGHAATTGPQERGYGQRTPDEHAPLAKAGDRAPRRLHRITGNGSADSGSSGRPDTRRPRATPYRPGDRRGCHRPGESGRNPAIVGPLARPSPDSRNSAILMRLRRPRTPVRAPRGGPPRTVREVGLTSRTGPPPAGNGAAVSPSPLSPVQWADPRGTQPSPSPAGRARAHGRVHGHTPGARRRPAGAPPERGPGGPHGQQSRHTDVCPLTVGMGRTTLCLLVFSTGGHIPRGSAICVCRRSTRVRTWGGIGTNAARRPR